MAAVKKKTTGRKGTSSKKTNTKSDNDTVLWSTVLIALGFLILAFSLIKGESAWLYIHDFLLGIFGITVFFIPAILFYTSYMISIGKSEHIKGKIVQSAILTAIISGMLRIFSQITFSDTMTVTDRIKELYSSGKELMGGGVLSVILGETLLGAFGKTGASIIIVLLLFVSICFVFNKTVFDFFRLIKNLFISASEAREEYREIPEKTRSEKYKTDEFVPSPGAVKREKSQKSESVRDDFNIDIAIPTGKKTRKEAAQETSDEVDIITKTLERNHKAAQRTKEFSDEIKEKTKSAKENMENASGELDSLIRKAALSGRNARQNNENIESKRAFDSIIKPVNKENQTDTQTENTVSPTRPENTENRTVIQAENTVFPADTINSDTAKKNIAATNNISHEYTESKAMTRNISMTNSDSASPKKQGIFGKSVFQGKASTLASKKITDENELDMPETMTAEDIQKEIIADEREVIEYHFPPIELLKESHNDINAENAEAEMKSNADILVNTLKSFGVMTRIVDIHRGPTVTRYELQPSAGVKISKITSLADDIALNLAAEGVRIEAPIPGKAAVGIEVPNRVKDTVTMRDIIDSEEFKNAKSKLAFAVGKNIDGEIVLGDISKLPHVIIAGTTGSGKSVCTNGIIMSILYNATPDEVRLVLIDPKVVEFKIYDGIPHLLIPVVTDPRKAAGALAWAVQEMLKRYKLFADRNVRDINGYNEKAQTEPDMEPLPRIVIVIDELADLMMAAAGEVEDSICRLAQMARAAGMHLIIATQRPTVDVITGLIKANIPSRIALKVASGIDSRSIINEIGAEKLLGQGDMLYFPTSFAKPVRVQNCFTSDKEVAAVVDYIKNGSGEISYDENIMNEIESNIPIPKGEKPADNNKTYEGSDDDLIERAMECVVDNNQCSTSYLQRKLKLGYARAARIVDELEEMGVVGPQDGAKPRQVLMSREEFLQRKMGTTAPVTYYDNTYDE